MGGAIVSPEADAIQRGVLCLRKMASAVWGMTLYRYLVALPSVLSLEPPVPDPPQVSPIHSALPMLEPRVSGCKLNFV